MGLGPHEPVSAALQMPRPEDIALAVLDAYSKKFGLTIQGYRGVWTVTGADLEQPITIEQYTELVAWLGRRFGRRFGRL